MTADLQSALLPPRVLGLNTRGFCLFGCLSRVAPLHRFYHAKEHLKICAPLTTQVLQFRLPKYGMRYPGCRVGRLVCWTSRHVPLLSYQLCCESASAWTMPTRKNRTQAAQVFICQQQEQTLRMASLGLRRLLSRRRTPCKHQQPLRLLRSDAALPRPKLRFDVLRAFVQRRQRRRAQSS